jgi:PhnB protein
MRFHPYLNFDGHCAEAFRFYAELLGGELEIMTHGDAPMAGDVPESWRDRVLHAALKVGDELLMGSDAPSDRFRAPAATYVSVHVDDREEAERIFNALAEGGRVEMPFQSTFWSPGFGSLADRWGTLWMVNAAQPAEAEAAQAGQGGAR